MMLKKTDVFTHRVFLLRVEGGCTQVTAKNQTARHIVLLITYDAPMTTGITCVSIATFVQAYF